VSDGGGASLPFSSNANQLPNELSTTLARERFTDVFVLQNGAWMALSAQETEL
jgi:hypothetical protein